jgi:hypothetical protein
MSIADVVTKEQPQSNWANRILWRTMASSSPTAARLAVEHVLMARSAARSKDLKASIFQYRKALTLWSDAAREQEGVWDKELLLTNKEYASILLNGVELDN